MTSRPRIFSEREYDRAAERYQRSLTLENYMEAPTQGTQRAITLACLSLVAARRADFHVFNELLVQYPNPDPAGRKIRQVVPDNMVVVWDGVLKVARSFNVPLQPCGPFWVMEYVSQTNERKDYEVSMQKYEHELKVPYYLLFLPEQGELTLYRHNGERYLSVPPDESSRHALPEIDMAIGLVDGWVRYWYQGELLPLPAELQRERDAALQRAESALKQADDQRERADSAQKQADDQRKRAELAEAELARVLAEIAALRTQHHP